MSLGFFLKQLISFFLRPLTLGIFLGFISLWYLYKGRIKAAAISLVLTLLWFVMISSAFVSNRLFAPLEAQYSRLQTVPENVDYLLLLGGDRYKRTWEAIRLYRLKPSLVLITSGSSKNGNISAAEITTEMLKSAGIPDEQILMQKEVEDTQQEALAIKKRIGRSPFLLVTSAYHMPRAMKIFEKEGVNPIAAPADFTNPKEDGVSNFLEDKQLRKTELALHEYIGLLWFYLQSFQ